MDLIVHGHNLDVSPRLKEYVEKKVGRLDRKLSDITEARMELSRESTRSAGDSQIAQLTLRTDRGVLLRAEERSGDMFAAINIVMDKISRQLERYKDRGKERKRQRRRDKDSLTMAALDIAADSAANADTGVDEDVEPELIVRRKRFPMKPMSEEDAIEQLELLDHPFFVFFNADKQALNVAYRRGDGSYGLLVPELE